LCVRSIVRVNRAAVEQAREQNRVPISEGRSGIATPQVAHGFSVSGLLLAIHAQSAEQYRRPERPGAR